ncbi:hypothetical protein [Marilutibacter chinensis]|uniref:Uncharacterized protein n=1 Tax=Marilutibacter chinensis TaxID=2912247 RepID=A0ABS9HVT6_9GAMM|nr:hypothetical protein [Lysobacter chinensis]MCF7222818.1 hypothetical protein [Lysobacter chinensis]
MKRIVRTWVLVVLIATGGTTLAQTPPAGSADTVEDIDRLQVILEQQRELKTDLDDGGIEGLTTRENNRVRKAQEQVFAVTEGKSRLDELSVDEKIELENALEQINAYVKNTRRAGDEQTVCWREKMSGTARRVTRCGTEAERREAREGARDWLERPKTCGQDCGGL